MAEAVNNEHIVTRNRALEGFIREVSESEAVAQVCQSMYRFKREQMRDIRPVTLDLNKIFKVGDRVGVTLNMLNEVEEVRLANLDQPSQIAQFPGVPPYQRGMPQRMPGPPLVSYARSPNPSNVQMMAPPYCHLVEPQQFQQRFPPHPMMMGNMMHHLPTYLQYNPHPMRFPPRVAVRAPVNPETFRPRSSTWFNPPMQPTVTRLQFEGKQKR